jgi:histidine kinase
VIEKAFDMFDQQLKVRGIEVEWDLDRPNLPAILAEPNRLEQVFVNLFLNARDAIEEKWELQVDDEKTLKGFVSSPVAKPTRSSPKSAIRAMGCRRGWRTKFSSRFSPPRRSARAPGWGCPSVTGLSKNWAGTFLSAPVPRTAPAFVIQFPLKAGRNGTNHTAGG